MNKNNDQQLAQRLNKCLDELDFPRRGRGKQLAKLIGLPEKRNYYRERCWLDGTYTPNSKNIQAIARALRVNPVWLEHGLGTKEVIDESRQLKIDYIVSMILDKSPAELDELMINLKNQQDTKRQAIQALETMTSTQLKEFLLNKEKKD